MNKTNTSQDELPPEFYTILFSFLASGATFIVKAFFEKYILTILKGIIL